MCGRFVSTTPPDVLAKYFGAETNVTDDAADDNEANYNVAPTQSIHVVFERSGVRQLDRFHWGLVPFWAKNPGVGNRMINARAETLSEKSAYKSPFAKRRCLIPADGFYEWKKVEGRKQKQPMFISRRDGDPMALAGLWAVWRDESQLDGNGDPLELHSCTIITGEPNEKIAEIHDRMPVMIPPDRWSEWLDRDNDDTVALTQLFVPAPAELFTVHPVSFEVNNVRNNGPQLTDEVEPDNQLF